VDFVAVFFEIVVMSLLSVTGVLAAGKSAAINLITGGLLLCCRIKIIMHCRHKLCSDNGFCLALYLGSWPS